MIFLPKPPLKVMTILIRSVRILIFNPANLEAESKRSRSICLVKKNPGNYKIGTGTTGHTVKKACLKNRNGVHKKSNQLILLYGNQFQRVRSSSTFSSYKVCWRPAIQPTFLLQWEFISNNHQKVIHHYSGL